MFRRCDITDIIVAIGLCAIVFGGCLFFVAANGTLQAGTSEPVMVVEPSGMLAGMTWLQPVLGQAILDEYLLEREASRAIAATVKELNRATMAQYWLQSSPDPSQQIAATAARVETDHATWVQAVMGQSIVNFTRRGVRSGVLPIDYRTSAFNERMIRTTQSMGHRLHDQFQATWQSQLGRAIVTAWLDQMKAVDRTQERVGHALVQVAVTQHTYEEAKAANQEQLASGIVAAIRTDALTEKLGRLAQLESRFASTPASTTTEPKSWPDIPLGYLIAASLGLVGVFLGGLSLALACKDTKIMSEMKRQTGKWVYRMTG